jgi:hypothetical protein
MEGVYLDVVYIRVHTKSYVVARVEKEVKGRRVCVLARGAGPGESGLWYRSM